jgi:heat shock protein HslJ
LKRPIVLGILDGQCLGGERSRMRGVWAVVLTGLLGLLPGIGAAADVLTGRAVLPDRSGLPAGSQFEVAFVDLAALDEDARVLGSLRLGNPVLPLRFTVPFDRSRLIPAHRYVLRAVVHDNGALIYNGEVAVPSRGPVTALTIALTPAGPAPAAGLPLRGEWRVIELDGEKLTDGESAVLLAFAEDGRLSGFAGCNRLTGRYEAADPVLRFSTIGLTRMACPAPAMAVEGRFIAALGAVANARLIGEQLELRDAAGAVRLKLESHHGH